MALTFTSRQFPVMYYTGEVNGGPGYASITVRGPISLILIIKITQLFTMARDRTVAVAVGKFKTSPALFQTRFAYFMDFV